MEEITQLEITVGLLIAAFVGLLIGAGMVVAFYELKLIIEKRDHYDETF